MFGVLAKFPFWLSRIAVRKPVFSAIDRDFSSQSSCIFVSGLDVCGPLRCRWQNSERYKEILFEWCHFAWVCAPERNYPLQWQEKHVNAGKPCRQYIYLFILCISLRKRASTCLMIWIRSTALSFNSWFEWPWQHFPSISIFVMRDIHNMNK
jgi:hypothetical protein